MIAQVNRSQQFIISGCTTVLFQSNRLQYEFSVLEDKLRETGDLIDSFLGRMSVLDTKLNHNFHDKQGQHFWDTLDLEKEALDWFAWAKDSLPGLLRRWWNR